MALNSTALAALKTALEKGLSRLSKQQMGAWALSNPGATNVRTGPSTRDALRAFPRARPASGGAGPLTHDGSGHRVATILITSRVHLSLARLARRGCGPSSPPPSPRPDARDGSLADPSWPLSPDMQVSSLHMMGPFIKGAKNAPKKK